MGSVGVRGPVRRGGGTRGTPRDLLKDSAARGGDVRGHEGWGSEWRTRTNCEPRTSNCVLRTLQFEQSRPAFREIQAGFSLS